MSGVQSQHMKFVFYKNGSEIDSTDSFTNLTLDFGLGVNTVEYVGRMKPHIYGTTGAASITGQMNFPSVLKDGTTYIDIAEAQRDKNNGLPTSLQIDCIIMIDLGTVVESIHLADCVISGLGMAASGRTDYVSISPTITSDSWKKLA